MEPNLDQPETPPTPTDAPFVPPQPTTVINPDSAPVAVPAESTGAPAGPVIAPPEPHKARRFSKKLVIVSIAVLLTGSGIAAALIYARNNSSSKLNPAQALVQDRTFVRMEEDAPYKKDAQGKVETAKNDEGYDQSVRNDSFSITLERNGDTKQLTLDSTVVEFGITNDDTFYALSCSVPKLGEVGGNNPSYTAQFYDKEGNKLTQKKWKELDTTAPDITSWQPSCYGDFKLNDTGKVDFEEVNYGREAIDSLNYKVVYVASDGTKHDIDSETTQDIDIPLGVTPDGKTFLYDRVSAKRVAQGCGSETNLAYKIPDFAGPINELHAVDIATKKDTFIGTEDSFSTDKYFIALDRPGYFSSDSSRYYLREGGRGGCRDGVSLPIRIPYIDLKTNKFHTIAAPTGKNYADYCYTDDGKYILEAGVVEDYDDTTPELPLEAPTVLDTKDGSTYLDDELTKEFSCAYTSSDSSLGNLFIDYDKTTETTEKSGESDVALLALNLFDPAKRTMRKISLDPDLDLTDSSFIKHLGVTGDSNIGYINLEGEYIPESVGVVNADGSYTQGTAVSKPNQTFLFNFKTGMSYEIPYAYLVL